MALIWIFFCNLDHSFEIISNYNLWQRHLSLLIKSNCSASLSVCIFCFSLKCGNVFLTMACGPYWCFIWLLKLPRITPAWAGPMEMPLSSMVGTPCSFMWPVFQEG